MTNKKPKKILYAAYLENCEKSSSKTNNMDIKEDSSNTKANDQLDCIRYILDDQTASYLSDLKLIDKEINLLNKFSYDDIIKLKTLFDKVGHKNVGRKKKNIDASIDHIYALHDSGMTYPEIARSYNVSLSTLNKFIRANKK